MRTRIVTDMKIFLNALFLTAFSFLAACSGTVADPSPASAAPGEIKQRTVEQAHAELAARPAQFIDVRTPAEYRSGHAAGAKNVPLDLLESRLSELNKREPVYVICQTGRRSQMASETLLKAGFGDIYNIDGGTSDWIKAGLPTQKPDAGS